MSVSDEEYEPKFSSLEEEFLHAARNGDLETVEVILAQTSVGSQFDINYKGTSKSNRGWTALHLAAYFGHIHIVRFLLERGADVNVANSFGDTPLHRAVYTGREELVTLLLQYKADILAVNSEGHLPKQLSKQLHIRKLLEATELHESNKTKDIFLTAAGDGNVDRIRELLKLSSCPAINSQDQFGNTALHLAALRNRSEVAVLLLQNGINTTIKNNKGQLPSDMAKTNQMKQLLDVRPIKTLRMIPQKCEGLILKKSKIFGFRMYYAVIEKGVLSYFINRGDAVSGSRRKGMKYLDEAIVKERDDMKDIRISFSDGTTHTLSTDVGNGTKVSKQKWLTALKEHIEFSTHYTHQGESFSEVEDELLPLGTMLDVLQNAQASQKVLENHVSKLYRSVEVLDNISTPIDSRNIKEQLRPIVESSKEMCGSLAHCMTLFTQQEELRQHQLKEEKERSRVLQEALRALALEHHELERSISSRRSSYRKYDTDDDEFYDCDSEGEGTTLTDIPRFHGWILPNFDQVKSWYIRSLGFPDQFESFKDTWSTSSFYSTAEWQKSSEDVNSKKYSIDFPLTLDELKPPQFYFTPCGFFIMELWKFALAYPYQTKEY